MPRYLCTLTVTEFRKRGHFAQKLKIELLVPRYSSLGQTNWISCFTDLPTANFSLLKKKKKKKKKSHVSITFLRRGRALVTCSRLILAIFFFWILAAKRMEAFLSVLCKRGATIVKQRTIIRCCWNDTFQEMISMALKVEKVEIQKIHIFKTEKFVDIHLVSPETPISVCEQFGCYNDCVSLESDSQAVGHNLSGIERSEKACCVYAHSRLTSPQLIELNRLKEMNIYTCRSPLFSNESCFIVVREALVCSTPIEAQYYGSVLVKFPPICYHCGLGEECLVNNDSIQELKMK